MIIVLKDGAVEEQGTHEELLRAGGLYAAMWNEQSMDTGASSDDEIEKLQEEVDELKQEREEAILAEHAQRKKEP